MQMDGSELSDEFTTSSSTCKLTYNNHNVVYARGQEPEVHS